MPFKDTDTIGQEADKDGAMSSSQAEKKLGGSFSKITDDDKGILTVTLTGCKNLEVRIMFVRLFAKILQSKHCQVAKSSKRLWIKGVSGTCELRHQSWREMKLSFVSPP